MLCNYFYFFDDKSINNTQLARRAYCMINALKQHNFSRDTIQRSDKKLGIICKKMFETDIFPPPIFLRRLRDLLLNKVDYNDFLKYPWKYIYYLRFTIFVKHCQTKFDPKDILGRTKLIQLQRVYKLINPNWKIIYGNSYNKHPIVNALRKLANIVGESKEYMNLIISDFCTEEIKNNNLKLLKALIREDVEELSKNKKSRKIIGVRNLAAVRAKYNLSNEKFTVKRRRQVISSDEENESIQEKMDNTICIDKDVAMTNELLDVNDPPVPAPSFPSYEINSRDKDNESIQEKMDNTGCLEEDVAMTNELLDVNNEPPASAPSTSNYDVNLDDEENDTAEGATPNELMDVNDPSSVSARYSSPSYEVNSRNENNENIKKKMHDTSRSDKDNDIPNELLDVNHSQVPASSSPTYKIDSRDEDNGNHYEIMDYTGCIDEAGATSNELMQVDEPPVSAPSSSNYEVNSRNEENGNVEDKMDDNNYIEEDGAISSELLDGYDSSDSDSNTSKYEESIFNSSEYTIPPDYIPASWREHEIYLTSKFFIASFK